MDKLLLVGLGGFVGSALRYGLGGWIARARSGWGFPVETLVINVTGCLAIGFLAGLAETRGVFTGATRALVFMGLLGGYTTFSSFGYETFQLMRDGQFGWALLSVALQVTLGLTGVWLGDALARLI